MDATRGSAERSARGLSGPLAVPAWPGVVPSRMLETARFAALLLALLPACRPATTPATEPPAAATPATEEVGASPRDELPPDAAPGVRAARDACARGRGDDCVALGVSPHSGLGGLKADDARAADLYQRACDLGSVKGCNNLAVMFEKGEGRPVDRRRAFQLYEQTCRAEHALGCRNLGRSYRDGLGVARNAAKARAAFATALELSTSACKAGVAEGCSNLGFIYRSGQEGVPKDEARARTYLERACEMGYKAVCSRVPAP